MLANNQLRHLSNSYRQMGKIQDQLATGKKISRASQDPVVAMNGMRYRTQVTEVEQFQRNLGEVFNWMDTADATLNEVTQTMHRIRELTVQASNDTYVATQRANISKEIAQLREHLVSLGNTRANNKYIFNGTNTTNAPIDPSKMNINSTDEQFLQRLAAADNTTPFEYEITFAGELYTLREVEGQMLFSSPSANTIEISPDGLSVTHTANSKDINGNTVTSLLKDSDIIVSQKGAVSTNLQNVEIELLKGVNVAVNINPNNVFTNDFFGEIIRLEQLLKDPTTTAQDMTQFLSSIDNQINKVVDERAELGARYNRVEMIATRVLEQEVIARRIMSNNEDADLARVIMDLMTQETVHRAALASSSRIIQPTLMDFLR